MIEYGWRGTFTSVPSLIVPGRAGAETEGSGMRKLTAVVVCAGLSILGACGGGGSKGTSSDTTSPSGALVGNGGDTTTTAPFNSGGGATQMGPPTGNIRIANLLTVNGAPGPAMDFYDVFHPTASDTPVIKDLKYGDISDYITPRAPSAGAPSNLYMYPAGSLTKTELLTGGNISPSGYVDGDQFTTAIVASGFSAGSFGETQIAEAGPNKSPAADLSAPAGKGVLLADTTANGDSSTLPLQFLMVDSACPLATSSNIPTSLGSGDPPTVLPVAPGHHTLGIVTSPPGRGLANCTGKTPSGTTTTVDVGAGQQIDVFAYGDPSHPKILTAPVAG